MTDDRWKERWKLRNPDVDREIFLDDSSLNNFFFTSLDFVSLESEIMLNTISVDSPSNFHMEIDSSIVPLHVITWVSYTDVQGLLFTLR